MGNRSNKKRDSSSFDRKSNKRIEYSEDRGKNICFNFSYLDKTQGQTYKDWEQNELLALLMDKLEHLSKLNIMEAQGGILTIYKDIEFPPKSKFKFPKHLPENYKFPENVKWAKIDIQGKERVIGFLENNVFYIVFLDKNHEFYPSEKKNT